METATQGLYTYRTRNYDGTFNHFHVMVEIVGETVRSYRIRLLQPLIGHPIGTRMTVRRHNVRINRQPSTKPDHSKAWWNN